MGIGMSMLALATATVGRLIALLRPGRHLCQVKSHSAPPSSSPPRHRTESSHPLDLGRDSEPSRFHVLALSAMTIGDQIDVWRESVSSERQTEAYESHGDWDCQVLPGRFLCVFQPSHPEVYSTPTGGHKAPISQSMERVPTFLPLPNELRSLPYASHVLENAESPAMELLSVKQFSSELITTTF
ncbi:hypothetical protein BKA70DRAFT_1440776 [Coprinopsis sp. MPI-PUGE-AT-0042]|nr:hypothetical protein BKA70DRAFT_1440776 [Coprinopsis sp. MPI-PUGE-AT-0042]